MRSRSSSKSQHSFQTNPTVSLQRSAFDRSHGVKTTFDAGWLIPIFVEEGLPGDTFNVKLNHLGRLATPLHPLMDNLFLDFFFFSVPYRLLWDNWEKFMGAQDAPGDSTSFVIPKITSPAGSGWSTQQVQDYMGLPTRNPGITHSVLPLRAYHRCWNDWFRDQDVQAKVTELTDDGPDPDDTYFLLRRGKRHDYFTSCRPFVQKGPAVQLPLGATAPVVTDGTAVSFDITNTVGNTIGGAGVGNMTWAVAPASGQGAIFNNSGLLTDLSSANAATVNEMRNAIAIQQLYEKDARGGTRYTEILRAHFGVTSPDQRLQRSEYLGGGSTRISVSQVPQTSESASTPQGSLAAYGTSTGEVGFTASMVEHTIVIGLVCLRADLNYQQGLPRMWSRDTRWDFYWPDLAGIGEQAVLSKEIYADGSANDEDVFGYTERYGEYKWKPSLITSKFRSNALASLDPWHVAQDFLTRPVLDDAFIVEDPPIDRAIAVTSEPHLIFDGHFRFRHVRPMATYNVPGLRRF